MVLSGVTPLGHDQPELSEQPADLVDLSRAILDQDLTNAMQAKRCLLIRALDWDKTHVGTRDSLTDGFRNVVIILATLAIRDKG